MPPPPPGNAEIADRFDLMADLLELEGAVVYRVLAYRRAARALRETPESIARLSAEGRLTTLPGIGDTISEKVAELLETGEISALATLAARHPPGVVEVMRIPGVGPRTAGRVFAELGVSTVEQLRAAARDGRIRELQGLGAKTESAILEGLSFAPAAASRRRSSARLWPLAERAAARLRESPAVVACDVAGSLRRHAETAADVDLVAAVTNRITASEAFVGQEWVAEVIARGEAKVVAVAHDGTRVELRLLAPGSYGNHLQHLTGSAEHNVALREAAVRAGLKVSEHGIEVVESGQVFRSDDEAEVYRRLGMDWIPPELREYRGELEAARAGTLPRLVGLSDVVGDLHSHTDWSDGKATLEQMVAAARVLGRAYLNVTDHSPAVGFGMGLDAGRLHAQIERVRVLAETLAPKFTLLVGAEVDILRDGSLDYSDELLEQLDVVVASVHASHRLSAADQTRRICAALENPHVDILGHPTGRLIGRRDPYPVEIEEVIATAVRTGTALEVSAQPDRLDLRDIHVRLAVEAGAKLTIDTDAHSVEALAYMAHGVNNARRGWATAADVVNTHPWPQARALLDRRP
ncbi:MAG TPA: DNA polymerase/3'-5' exonuclease PolX [Gaiellales bacterium]|nr:DNA polymerase/3'-5' exonuclease PolX [Gaiellales bacterium]